MKANEFVKKYGIEYAMHILSDDAPIVMDLNYIDLKRLVESHELVESLGGSNLVKSLIIQAPSQASHWGKKNSSYYSYDGFYGQWKQYWDIQNAPMWQTVFSMQFEGRLNSLGSLKQAIADVESCL